MTRTWLITGASRGLGRAIARGVLEAGHNVVATARDPARIADLCAVFPDRAAAVALDVTDEAAARLAVETAIARFGRLDVVVNNAGYADLGSIEDLPPADFRRQVETNFFGAVNVTRAALPAMREQGSGHFFQISSIGARAGAAGLSGYQAAKWALEGFSEVLFREVSPLGIKVTIIEPGGFRTDWAGSSMRIVPIRPEYEASIRPLADYLRSHTGKEPGDPAKAAEVLLEVAEMDEPPMRLLLGSDALRNAGMANAWRAAEDEKWAHLSRRTDHENPGQPGSAPPKFVD